jgi:hypothetical protein
MGDSTTESKNKKAHHKDGLFIPRFREDKFNLGNVLLSHTVAHAVPSALKGLTSVFGMGTGVSPSPWSPRISFTRKRVDAYTRLHFKKIWMKGIRIKLQLWSSQSTY